MLTFSVNKNRSLRFDKYANELWILINANERYFRKFNGDRADEAMLETWTHMLEHRDNAYDCPLPYMKKLARTILHKSGMEIPLSAFSSNDTDDESDTSFVFDSLAEMNEGVKRCDNKVDKQSIDSVLSALYLEDPVSFEKLRFLTESMDTTSMRDSKRLFDKDSFWFSSFNNLLKSYSASMIRDCLCNFFKELNKEKQKTKFSEGVKVFDIVPMSNLIPFPSEMIDSDGILYRGKRYVLNPRKLLTSFEDVDIDHVSWSVLSNRDVIKIAYDEIIDTIIDDIMVEEGVNTPLITWCKGSYIMETLSGFKSFVNTDKSAFIDICRQEIISNIASVVKSIVAVSDRYIYATPTRKLRFNEIVFRSKQGHRYKVKIERK